MRRSSPEARETLSPMDGPGTFQCLLLRALELRKIYRDVFLLRDLQGHPIPEIAAQLGISVETARARLKRARREVGFLQSSGHAERMK
jgi:DNA-directed RNA polymerase specialized sigma24 family protein